MISTIPKPHSPLPASGYKTVEYEKAYAAGAKAAANKAKYVNPHEPAAVAQHIGWVDGYYDAWSTRANQAYRASPFRTESFEVQRAVLTGS